VWARLIGRRQRRRNPRWRYRGSRPRHQQWQRGTAPAMPGAGDAGLRNGHRQGRRLRRRRHLTSVLSAHPTANGLSWYFFGRSLYPDASEAMPFPGADSVVSSLCGAISGRLKTSCPSTAGSATDASGGHRLRAQVVAPFRPFCMGRPNREGGIRPTVRAAGERAGGARKRHEVGYSVPSFREIQEYHASRALYTVCSSRCGIDSPRRPRQCRCGCKRSAAYWTRS
jgi:hypothetical protein